MTHAAILSNLISPRNPFAAGVESHDAVLRLSQPMTLAHGGVLSEVRVAWRLSGPAGAPVVCALGGISADRHVCSWWGNLVGAGKAIDTGRRQVLAFDFLGGNGATTGPRSTGAAVFPDVSTFDQAYILAALLDHLAIPRLAAFVGASYGGMVALAFASLYPERVERLVVISAAHKASPLGTAWRTIQRRIVALGTAHGSAHDGLALARALAMTTYRTPGEFDSRFDAPRRVTADPDAFPVWEYLDARGADYVTHMLPEAFVTLSRSIDLHRIEPEQITTPLNLVAVAQDQLVPPALVGELARRAGGVATVVACESIFGHDAFLKEEAFFTKIFERI